MAYVHLGIDYGTSATKIVVRDYAAAGGEKTYPLKWLTSEHNEYRLPSCVATTQRYAWFGLAPGSSGAPRDADWHFSMKMRVAAQHCADQERVRVYARALRQLSLPLGWGYETLFVASLVWIIRRALEQTLQLTGYSSRDVRYGVTFGLPTDFRHDPTLARFFMHRYRAAFTVARDEDLCRRRFPPGSHQVTLDDAFRLAITNAIYDSERQGVDDMEYWHQSEARASVLWAWNSPAFGSGSYLHVDVGAGTTNVVGYLVNEQPRPGGGFRKVGISVFASQSGPVGLDAFGPGAVDIAQRLRADRELERQLSTPYRSVFGRIRAMTSGHETTWRQWETAKIVSLGGGSTHAALERAFGFHPYKPRVTIDAVDLTEPPPDLQLGLPRGIRGSQLRREQREARRSLAIAYGLSMPGAMLPEEVPPDQLPPLQSPTPIGSRSLEGFYEK